MKETNETLRFAVTKAFRNSCTNARPDAGRGSSGLSTNSPGVLCAYFTNVSPCGTTYLKMYAESITIIPTIEHNATECQATKRRMIPSFPTCWVAAMAIVIDCASTIFLITPPALLAAHISTGSMPSCLRSNSLQTAKQRGGRKPVEIVARCLGSRLRHHRYRARDGVVHAFHPDGPDLTLPSTCTIRKAGVVALFMASLILGSPQSGTKSDRTANGIRDVKTCPPV